METETAATNLEQFRALVAADPELHAELRDTTDRQLFIEEAVRLGWEWGLPFNAAAVQEALMAERQRWNGQWMK